MFTSGVLHLFMASNESAVIVTVPTPSIHVGAKRHLVAATKTDHSLLCPTEGIPDFPKKEHAAYQRHACVCVSVCVIVSNF